MKKRSLSILLALTMLFALLVPSVFAENSADTTPALTVYEQTVGGEAKAVKSYTASELAALKTTGTVAYQFYKNDVENMVVGTEYVALDALFADAGLTMGEKDSVIAADNAETPFTSTATASDLAACKYYINGETKTEVPAALLLTWGSGAGTVDEIAAKAADTGSIRFCYGISQEQYADKSARGKRLASGVASVTLVHPAPVPFTDVDAGSYYYEALKWAYTGKIAQGTSATTFAPGENCSRAQCVTLLWRMAGSPAPTSTETAFTDLDKDQYYYSAVLWGVEKGIVQGVTATTFAPDSTVSRAEAVTFFYRYMNSPTPAEGTVNPFTDLAKGDYCYDAVLWASQTGVTQGVTPTTFDPKGICNRGELVTFLYRVSGLNA